MKILVTGARGFIGKNLTAELKNRGYEDLILFDREDDPSCLDEYAPKADFIFHLAGVNRPKDVSEFMEGNCGLTEKLINILEAAGSKAPVLVTSSIQAALDNPYGQSKKAGEELLFSHKEKTGAPVFVYRLPNVFGKWSRPNYNSAVATFCHNIANDLPITVNDPATVMRLVYIDDVVAEFINAMEDRGSALSDACIYTYGGGMRPAKEESSVYPVDGDRYFGVPRIHEVKLGEIADLIHSFKQSRSALFIPDMSDAFVSSLYSTYLSYLPTDGFAYDLKMNVDNRGSFTEFIRNRDRGQVSVNISHPGITKGQHWHHSKNEKFLVVKGEGLIRFRRIDSDEIFEYRVSGEKLQVVDIPTGYTHSIVNVGEEDMVTVMWANEPFNPDKPDTYYLEV